MDRVKPTVLGNNPKLVYRVRRTSKCTPFPVKTGNILYTKYLAPKMALLNWLFIANSLGAKDQNHPKSVHFRVIYHIILDDSSQICPILATHGNVTTYFYSKYPVFSPFMFVLVDKRVGLAKSRCLGRTHRA